MRIWLEPPETGVSPELLALVDGNLLAAQALCRRGFVDARSARAFLDPDDYLPADPFDFPGMDRAVLRLQAALRQGEHILVWGDFDVDGQTSTALLVEALGDLGARRVSYHIPLRAQESHGMSQPVLQQFLETPDDPPSLVLTCDTGIAAHPAAVYAQGLSVDLIITDHHELPISKILGDPLSLPNLFDLLPPACAIVTPRLLADGHPLSSLPGVGVAYKLAEALYQRAGDPHGAEKFEDLAALGIVADVALQVGDARYLLQRGLQRLRQPERVGFQAIYERAQVAADRLTEEQIGFVIAPRLNALGRLSDANPAVELLTTKDRGRARLLALEMEGLNSRRQMLTNDILKGALAQLEREPALLDFAILVLAHSAWPAGVIGIVASRLVEWYARPVVMISAPEGEPARGSARSVEGVDITAAIAEQSDLLLGFGGHVMAAGFSIPAENVALFRSRLSGSVANQLAARAAQPAALKIDGVLEWGDLSLELAQSLERLAPFGAGNPALTLASKGLHLVSRSSFGRQGEHLQLLIEDANGVSRRVVWWGGGEEMQSGRGSGERLPSGEFDLAYTIRATTFRGQAELSILYEDIRPSAGSLEIEPARPQVEFLDYRRHAAQKRVLIQLLEEHAPALLQIWAEGESAVSLKKELQKAGRPTHSLRSRDQLEESQTIVIWNAPPGWAEWTASLERCNPGRVIVFGLEPGLDQPQVFLERLMGLVKYGIAHNEGQVDWARLASAAAQRELTVRLGLEWLEAMGQISIRAAEVAALPAPHDSPDQPKTRLVPGGAPDPPRAALLKEQIKDLLEETRAYREYFRRMDLQ